MTYSLNCNYLRKKRCNLFLYFNVSTLDKYDSHTFNICTKKLWNEFYVMKIKSNDKKSTINNKNNRKKSKIIHMTRRYLFSLRLLIFVKKWKERKGVEEQDVNRL